MTRVDPEDNHHVSIRTHNEQILLFGAFVMFVDPPTEARGWTGRDFQMSRTALDSKKNREVFNKITQAKLCC